MALYRYPSQGNGFTKDQNGRTLVGVNIACYLTGTNTPAKIYKTSAGGTAVYSITSSTVDGSFAFWMSDADYPITQLFDVTQTLTGYATVTNSSIAIIQGSTIAGPSTTVIGNIATWGDVVGMTMTDSGQSIAQVEATAVATAVATLATQIQPISASVGSNALTLNLANTSLDFRSATLTSGAVNSAVATGALSLTVAAGATLGTVNTVQAQLAILVLYNAGTPVLAVVNMAGGVNLDETTLISSTALSGSSNSASTVYSTAGVTSSPFRVVGYINITEATAGTWATAPSLIQGEGGQALVGQQTLGMGQTWQDVTASRVIGTLYYNTTARPISVLISLQYNSAGWSNVYVNGLKIGYTVSSYATSAVTGVFFIVPPGQSYELTNNTGTPTLDIWAELR